MLDFDELEVLEQAKADTPTKDAETDETTAVGSESADSADDNGVASTCEEPAAETEEESAKREEADGFKAELELEVEAERRVQLSHLEGSRAGVPGYLLMLPEKESGGKTKVCFVDVLNEQLLTLYKMLMKRDAVVRVGLELLQQQLIKFARFCGKVVQCRFNDRAIFYADRLVCCFTDTKRSAPGLCSIVKDMLAEETPRRKLKDFRASGDAALKKMLDLLKKLLTCCVAPTVQDKWLLEHGFDELKDFDNLPRPSPLWVINSGDEKEIMLSFAESPSNLKRVVIVGKSWKVSDLRRCLVHLGMRPEIELCSADDDYQMEGEQFAALPLEQVGSSIVVLYEDGHAWGLRDYWPDTSKVFVFVAKVLKTTAISATHILWELREKFRAKDFQKPYFALRSEASQNDRRNVKLVEMTFGVQSKILPKYGFAANSKGLQEMRDEISVHADNGSDLTVNKIRRDIHTILDMFHPLPAMPVIRSVVPPRFELSEKDKWLRHLADEGYAVVAGIVSPNEVKEAYKLLWDFIEESDITKKIKRDDVLSWENPHGLYQGWPAGLEDGIIHTNGIGQSRFLWHLRGLPAVKKVFTEIWGTEHLVTSFDGAGVFRPYGHDPKWKTTKTNWHHVDQAHRKRGLHCVQGLLTMKDANKNTGGLVVVPRSHRLFNEVLKSYPEPDKYWDFIGLSASDKILTEGQGGPRLVCAQSGDLILWDSRTVHSNTSPLVEDEDVIFSEDLIRAVAYVCMTPAIWCTSQTLTARESSFRRGVTTAHWPHEQHEMNCSHRAPNFELTMEQKKLVCPQLFHGWDEEAAQTGTLARGVPSCLPEEHFAISSPVAYVRRSPTLEWGTRNLITLQKGHKVSGHVFGNWLLISSSSDSTITAAAGEEAWCMITSSECSDDDPERKITQLLKNCSSGPD